MIAVIALRLVINGRYVPWKIDWDGETAVLAETGEILFSREEGLMPYWEEFFTRLCGRVEEVTVRADVEIETAAMIPRRSLSRTAREMRRGED